MNAMTMAEALSMLAEAFNEPVEKLSPDVHRDQIEGWDSMGALLLIAELDERFGLALPADESRAMKKVGDALDFLRRHGVLAE